MKYGFIIDNRKCIGCHACTVACKAEHNVPVGVYRTWVKYIEKGVFPNTRRMFTVHRCNHCSDAPCVEICPVASLHMRDDGIVDFDPQRCIGCKSCMQACPYDALYIDPVTSTSAKCNYCAHRIDKGFEPACVNVCPTHAIISGDMDNPDTEIAQLLSRQTVTVRKPEKHTNPNLFYIHADEAALRPELAPPKAEYLVTGQASGVGHFAKLAKNPDGLTDPGAQARAMGLFKGKDDNGAADAGNPVPVVRTQDAPQKGVLWGWEVSGYLWTKSISAGVVLLPAFLELIGVMEVPDRLAKALAMIALVFLGLTGALLVKDLDRPERFLYVLLRPQWRSWLVRGAYIINVFGALTTLWAVDLFLNLGVLSGSPWFMGLLAFSALMTAIYTAFLLAQAKGRDFWQSPLLPFHMLVQSIMAGGAVTLLLGHLGQMNLAGVLGPTLAVALATHLAMLAIEFTMPHVTTDTARVLKLIVAGPLRTPFWSAVVLGNLLPLVLLLATNTGLMVLPAALLVLLFALVIEHVWVRAPQMISLR